MSKSPRRLLRRAADAVSELEQLRGRYPEVDQELWALLGEEGFRELTIATETLRRAAALVDKDGLTAPPPSEGRDK